MKLQTAFVPGSSCLHFIVRLVSDDVVNEVDLHFWAVENKIFLYIIGHSLTNGSLTLSSSIPGDVGVHEHLYIIG